VKQSQGEENSLRNTGLLRAPAFANPTLAMTIKLDGNFVTL